MWKVASLHGLLFNAHYDKWLDTSDMEERAVRAVEQAKAAHLFGQLLEEVSKLQRPHQGQVPVPLRLPRRGADHAPRQHRRLLDARDGGPRRPREEDVIKATRARAGPAQTN